MRPVGLLVAVLGLVALSMGIVAGGRSLGEPPVNGAPLDIEIDDIPLDMTDGPDGDQSYASPGNANVSFETVASVASARLLESDVTPFPAGAPRPHGVLMLVQSNPVPRAVSPSIVAPPDVDLNLLERIEPRAPLSKLGQARPPKPEMPEGWKGTVLHRPVATESARFEAMGRTIAISGTESVPADATCSFEGRDWNCGVRARTAFRLFLRGRAPNCVVPPDAEPGLILASCKLGKQDVGAWLVANGWARATEGGPYMEAGAKAEAERKGIFGAPPRELPAARSYSNSGSPAGVVMPLDPGADSADSEPEDAGASIGLY